MLWLPELMESGVGWRLPLSLGAASALAASLISEPNQPVVAALHDALSEPSLAVWTVHRGWSLGCGEMRTVASAAEWLARHARTALVWGEAESVQTCDKPLVDDYLRLSATSVRVAALARDGVLSGDVSSDVALSGDVLSDDVLRDGVAAHTSLALEADEAYLLGLLHATDEWWKLAARRRSGGIPHVVPRAPPWLTEALGQLQDPSCRTTSRAVARVARARQIASHQGASAARDRLEVDHPPSKGTTALAASLASLSGLARRPSQGDFDQLEAAKLEAMAEFAAGAGHEINNPLAVIAGRAQLLLEGESNPQRRRELAVIHSQAMRVYEMIADMMLFARPPKPKRAPCDLRHLLRQVVSEITLRAAARNVGVSLELPEEVDFVQADATQVAAAVRAICDNALTAVDRGGRVGLRLEKSADRSPEQRSVAIVVTDNGSGIPPEVRAHIFDPFYCGRPAGRGLGMGLAKAWRIVRSHAGRIEVDSEPGVGSTFRIVLPSA